MLTVTDISHKKINDELVISYFDGGQLTDSQIKNIKYSDGEILNHIFVNENDVLNHLRENAHYAFLNIQKSLSENKTLLFEINN